MEKRRKISTLRSRQVEKTDIEKKKKPVPIVFSITNLLQKKNSATAKIERKIAPIQDLQKKRHN